ncbi:MAG: hypothetical protein E7384_01190 [Ruminococcaceae bacterium]|nr:hypothetical protein [Oscillospiraceae bacterium]
MKRRITFALALIMLLSVCLCACGSEESEKPALATPRPAEETYNLAMYYVSKGNYEMGYAALLSISDYDKAAEALENFYHLPGKMAERKAGETNPDNYDITMFSYGKGGIILERSYHESGVMTAAERFTYENGLLKTSEFRSNGDKKFTASYTFDGEGRLYEIVMKDAEENFAKKDYKYGTSGKVTEETITDFDGTVTINKFSYNKNEQLSVKRSCRIKDGEETVIAEYEYIYNEKGVLIGADKTADGKKYDVGYSEHRLFYNPDYSDLMLYY